MSRSNDQRVQDIPDAANQILDVVRDGRGMWDKDRLGSWQSSACWKSSACASSLLTTTIA